jgi:hypothetical protein
MDELAPPPFWRRGIFNAGAGGSENDLAMARSFHEKQKTALLV